MPKCITSSYTKSHRSLVKFWLVLFITLLCSNALLFIQPKKIFVSVFIPSVFQLFYSICVSAQVSEWQRKQKDWRVVWHQETVSLFVTHLLLRKLFVNINVVWFFHCNLETRPKPVEILCVQLFSFAWVSVKCPSSVRHLHFLTSRDGYLATAHLLLHFITVLSQLGIRVAFTGESQLLWSCATQPMVPAGCFSVSIIHWTLTGTTGSLTCTQMLTHVIAYREEGWGV